LFSLDGEFANDNKKIETKTDFETGKIAGYSANLTAKPIMLFAYPLISCIERCRV
jgi:hypothetical protein